MEEVNTLTSGVNSIDAYNTVIAELYKVLCMVGAAQDACIFYGTYNSTDRIKETEFAKVEAVIESVYKALQKGINDVENLFSSNN